MPYIYLQNITVKIKKEKKMESHLWENYTWISN